MWRWVDILLTFSLRKTSKSHDSRHLACHSHAQFRIRACLNSLCKPIILHTLPSNQSTVCPDNDKVINIATKSISPAGYEDISGLLIALVSYTGSRHTLLFDHTQGHSSHPWNDLSDSVSKRASKHGGMTFITEHQSLATVLQG